MTGQFITQSNDRIYVITAPNSDAQFKGFTDCLNCKDWWCEIKYTM
ncbi:N-acetylmuramoyl-L-alanine amidase C-terminal domain-containing protein [Bacillus toyonensis]